MVGSCEIRPRRTAANTVLASRVAAVLIAQLVAGCVSLYVHDASTQKATSDAKTQFDALKLTAVFDDESQYIDGLQRHERAAVVAEFAAERDAELILLMQGSPQGFADGGLLASRLDGYLRSIAGKSDRAGRVKLWRIVADAYEKPGDEQALKALRADLAVRLNSVTEPANVTSLPSPGTGPNLADALAAVESAHKTLSDDQTAGKEAQKALDGALKDASSSLTSGPTAQSKFDKLAQQVNSALADANPYIRSYVSSSLADKVDSLIAASGTTSVKTPSTLTAEAKDGLTFVHAALGVGDAFSNPPRVPHPNALASVQAWLRYVESGAEAQINEAQADLATAKAQASAAVTQVYYLSRAAEALEAAEHSRKVGTEGRDPFVPALIYLADAWNRGFEPMAQIAVVEGPLAKRRAKLLQSRNAGTAWVGVLGPGVATLAAYGAGGLDPQALASLLQALGVGAIAVGVNK